MCEGEGIQSWSRKEMHLKCWWNSLIFKQKTNVTNNTQKKFLSKFIRPSCLSSRYKRLCTDRPINFYLLSLQFLGCFCVCCCCCCDHHSYSLHFVQLFLFFLFCFVKSTETADSHIAHTHFFICFVMKRHISVTLIIIIYYGKADG